jgi:hypothetical protein
MLLLALLPLLHVVLCALPCHVRQRQLTPAHKKTHRVRKVAMQRARNKAMMACCSGVAATRILALFYKFPSRKIEDRIQAC